MEIEKKKRFDNGENMYNDNNEKNKKNNQISTLSISKHYDVDTKALILV